MERTAFLKLCQIAAVNQGDLHSFEAVKFNEIVYRPVGYQLEFDRQGKPVHTAILKDLKANSLLYCRLEDVKIFKKNLV